MKPGWLGYLGRLAGVLAGNALLAYGWQRSTCLPGWRWAAPLA